MQEVFIKSGELCKYSYTNIKPPSIWESVKLASKHDLILQADETSKNKIKAFHILELQRDRKGRELDVKPSTLLSNNTLAIIAARQPESTKDMFKIIDPLPEFIENNLQQIIDLLQAAKQDLEKTIYKLLDLPESNERLKK